MKKFALMSAALLAALSSVASADQYEDEVVAQLLMVEGAALTEGYEQFGDIALESMDDTDADVYELYLDADTDYMIVGVCDSDCRDIDFRLYDEYGDFITEDVRSDDAPVLEFTTGAGGGFYIEIEMFDCGVSPCTYGIMTLER
jgi:opacity protein-like surface antigen